MGQQTYQVQEAEQTFGQFLWNPSTKEFLGRDGTSWGKIFVFYVIFYLFLAGFMSMTLAVFYQTLSYEVPTYQPGDGSSILKNPALGFRPLPPPDRIESTLIWYDVNNNKTYNHSINSINDFVASYDNQAAFPKRKLIVCSNTKKPNASNEVCSVDVTALGPDCTKEKKWGFPMGEPCILLKLNKMYNWEADFFLEAKDLEEKKVPKHIDTMITKGKFEKRIWVNCEGENEADNEYLGEVMYYPQQGFPSYYYPYVNTPGYLPPIVSVQFTKVKYNVLINIECTIWAKNIQHNRKRKLGMAHFELLVDKAPEVVV